MSYDYQYDIAGLAATIFLLVIYLLRRNYRTKSNILLLLLMICNSLGCIGDIISCFTISYPERYPLWLNYGANMLYIYCYNTMAVLFFLFVDSKAKIESMIKKSMVMGISISIIEFLMIITTPLHGFVFYIDENKVYHRGVGMYALYVIAGSMLVGGIVLLCKGKKRFNRYQVIAFSLFIVVIIFTVSFQMLFPRYLIGQMGCAFVLFFLFTAFENPVYYTYRDSRCFNQKTFLQNVKIRLRNNKKFSVIAFAIRDYKYMKRTMSLKDIDRLSSQIAEFIYVTFRDAGFCVADDKFVILLDGEKANDESVKNEVIEKLQQFFLHPVMLIDEERKVDINYWYLTGLDSTLSIDDIVDSLENLMEKDSGEVEDVYNIKDLVAQVNRKQSIVHILSRAVANEEFDVYYQPIYSVSTHAYNSVEALVRLYDKDLGFISPEEFIPIAEESGTIYAIGEIVFRKVCRFMSKVQAFSLGVYYVEINLSPLQCFQENLVEIFDEIMHEYQIEPSWINLEFTETAEFAENNIMSKNIKGLHERGITFSLDDFGSGFASMDYLFKLPVTIVKIDKSILWQAVKDNKAMITLKGTMKMLKDLGKLIVVEGVETNEMVDILEENGCDYMQGYFYSKPLPETMYLDFLQKHQIKSL